MSQKLICHQNWNITKTEMSPKLIGHQKWNVTNLKCHQNWSFTNSELSQKLKCHQNWNVIKTEMLPWIIFVLKNKKNKIPEIGTEYPGLVLNRNGPTHAQLNFDIYSFIEFSLHLQFKDSSVASRVQTWTASKVGSV